MKRNSGKLIPAEPSKSDFDSFFAIIRKYTGIREFSPAIADEFIKKIIVHAPEKADGKRILFSALRVNSIFFLLRNRNGRTHRKYAR